MKKLFFTRADGIYGKLDKVLFSTTGKKQEILRTGNGKPYICGNQLYFSVSHSGDKGVIAVSDLPVGVDLEVFKDRGHGTLLSRFPQSERSEIHCERDFLVHWTAREAFIKMRGEKLFENLKNLEYRGGRMYLCGSLQNCRFAQIFTHYGVVSVCSEKR